MKLHNVDTMTLSQLRKTFDDMSGEIEDLKTLLDWTTQYILELGDQSVNVELKRIRKRLGLDADE